MAEDIDRSSQILAIVLDSSQVVSYKWLSRNFSISSNDSKRLLQNVVEQHGSSLDIIYAVSGWSRTDGHCYSVKLVPKSKLREAKDMLDGHISVHIYSIQPCIPKDPAELWSAEYVQSEELFKQPPELNNCLRDNRFSAVSCSSVTRKVLETSSAGNARLAPKVAAPSGGKVTSSPPSIAQVEVLAAQPSTSGPSRQNMPGNSAVDVRTGPKGSEIVAGLGNKGVVATKKKTAGAGDGALANLWGRASTKPKPVLLEAQGGAAANTGTVNTSERVHDYSIDASSDEDAANFARVRRGDVKSSSKRTRRMIVDDDMSDEDNINLERENHVSLSSPEVPKEKVDLSTFSEKKGKELDASVTLLEEVSKEKVDLLIFSEKKGKQLDASVTRLKEVDSVDIVKEIEKKAGKKALKGVEETNKSIQAADNGASTAAPELKKRKVLKTRIDERGREVTEVVWETENSIPSDDSKEANCLSAADAHVHSQAAPSKAPSVRSLGSVNAKSLNGAVQISANKASGNKSTGKAASKDAQQGRISSFFKKKS